MPSKKYPSLVPRVRSRSSPSKHRAKLLSVRNRSRRKVRCQDLDVSKRRSRRIRDLQDYRQHIQVNRSTSSGNQHRRSRGGTGKHLMHGTTSKISFDPYVGGGFNDTLLWRITQMPVLESNPDMKMYRAQRRYSVARRRAEVTNAARSPGPSKRKCTTEPIRVIYPSTIYEFISN